MISTSYYCYALWTQLPKAQRAHGLFNTMISDLVLTLLSAMALDMRSREAPWQQQYALEDLLFGLTMAQLVFTMGMLYKLKTNSV